VERRVRSFLAAVRENPDDDDPRLVLADLYEDLGDPDRATFIRLQLKRARLDPWAPEAVLLELRERALLARHERRWRAELPAHPSIEWGDFERGLVSSVHCFDLEPRHLR
jgi:uncharacterized protein (TIGR02996 family)